MKHRAIRLPALLALLALVLFSLFPQSVRHAAASNSAAPARHGPPYKVVLSNGYIGNQWRIEMENEFKAACQMAPFKTVAQCSIYNAGLSVATQIQQMNNIISSRPDAIVINADSVTALNGVIAQACSAGIVVVSYDNVVTAPCALKVNTDQVVFGHQLAQFIADNLPNHSGNVIEVTGPPGQPVDISRLGGAAQVFSKYPGIKIIAKYTGMWASNVAQTNTATQLTSLGKVDAVWCEGGTDGVIKSFLAAKRPLPAVIAGEAENGFRQYMLQFKSKGLKSTSLGQPPFLVLVSLELAYEVLQGKHARDNITIPFPAVTQDTVKEGVTTFKNLPSSFFADFTDSGPKATVQICVNAALTGSPCPGPLVIRLPK